MSDLFILNRECGEAGLELLTSLVQVTLQWLLCTHHPHLHTNRRNVRTVTLKNF